MTGPSGNKGGETYEVSASNSGSGSLKGRVAALYDMLCQIFGTDQIVLKAKKLEALELFRSDKLPERILGLQRVVYENPTLEEIPKEGELWQILMDIEGEIADMAARRYVENDLEKKIMEKIEENQEEYLEEIKAGILKKASGPENAQTLKRLAILEKKEQEKLTRSILEVLRPQSLDEVVGQERGVKALISKIASPFPQHILIYGPPGVGKTTAARLALEEAKKFKHTPFGKDAPFVETNGATLRWDPRESTNPLLGSVHDPIYQGARTELAEFGIPEPKLGLVSDANGGVLFIDEIGEMDPLLVNKLIKVLEDKRVNFQSSYYDALDDRVPQYIRKLFNEGAPADFILIGATTRDASTLNPALRSRCAEVHFEPLAPDQIKDIIDNAASKLGVVLEEGARDVISEYTIEGRKAISILADTYSLALYKNAGGTAGEKIHVTAEDVYEVVRNSRMVPYGIHRAKDSYEVGRTFGLAVSGYLGTVLEIEAVAFPAEEKGKGKLCFNETMGSMTKDSIFNAAAIIRMVTG
ncbi:MAG: ATP-dependent protease, Lon family, partial [Clostridia bacterium]|nr:ATP-dependent protease, Lon family [Clostridia bacterium]